MTVSCPPPDAILFALQGVQEGRVRLPVQRPHQHRDAREEADPVCDEHVDQGPRIHQEVITSVTAMYLLN